MGANRMAKCTSEHAYGHQGTTNIIGPNKQREYWLSQHFSKVCTECKKQQYANIGNQAVERDESY